MRYFVPLMVLVPILIGIMKYYSLDPKMRVLFFYLLIAAVFSAVTTAMAQSGKNNLPLFHLFTFLEGVLILIFYKSKPGTITRNLFFILLIAFSGFCFVNSFFIQQLFKFNTYSRFGEALMIISLCLYYFYLALVNKNPIPWYRDPLTLVNIGLLLYFSSSLLLFLFSQALLSNKQVNIVAWVLHATLLLMMYLLFGLSFFQYRNKPQEKSVY